MSATTFQLYDAIKQAAIALFEEVEFEDAVDFLDICQSIDSEISEAMVSVKAQYIENREVPKFNGWFAYPGWELGLFCAAADYVGDVFEGVDDANNPIERDTNFGQMIFMKVIGDLLISAHSYRQAAVLESGGFNFTNIYGEGVLQ